MSILNHQVIIVEMRLHSAIILTKIYSQFRKRIRFTAVARYSMQLLRKWLKISSINCPFIVPQINLRWILMVVHNHTTDTSKRIQWKQSVQTSAFVNDQTKPDCSQCRTTYTKTGRLGCVGNVANLESVQTPKHRLIKIYIFDNKNYYFIQNALKCCAKKFCRFCCGIRNNNLYHHIRIRRTLMAGPRRAFTKFYENWICLFPCDCRHRGSRREWLHAPHTQILRICCSFAGTKCHK